MSTTETLKHRLALTFACVALVGWAAPVGAAEPGPAGTPALEADLLFPYGLAHDGKGSLYLVERAGRRVRRIDLAAGTIHPFAGGGEERLDAGAATETLLSAPNDLAVAPDGRVIVSDTYHHRLLSVDPESGRFVTLAGNGEAELAGDGGPARRASIVGPYGLAFDSGGHLLVADTDAHRIRRIDAETGVITTVAGDGKEGFSGDGGPATDASFSRPHVLVALPGGDLVIGDSFNHRIRRIDGESGRVHPLAGNGEEGQAPPGTAAAEAAFRFFGDMVLDPGGAVVVSEWGNHRIVRIDLETSTLEVIAGTGQPGMARDGALGPESPIGNPLGLAYDGEGHLFFTEASIPGHGRCGRVVRLDAESGRMRVIAGRVPCEGGE